MVTRWFRAAPTQAPVPLWHEMRRFQDDFNKLFNDFGLAPRGSFSLAAAYPALNCWEDEGHIFVEAELPGMALEDLEIYVTGGDQLTLKGERRPPQPEHGSWHRQERGFGAFSRTLTLPAPVNSDKVEARFLHGVLTVKLPKAEAARPRKITVKSE